MTTSDDLQEEFRIYSSNREQLLAAGHAGKFVLVGDGCLCGTWDTYEDALQAGYSRFGVAKRFLVKKIEAIESLQFFTRDITPCQV